MAALELGKPGDAVTLMNKSLLHGGIPFPLHHLKCAETGLCRPLTGRISGFWIPTSKLRM